MQNIVTSYKYSISCFVNYAYIKIYITVGFRIQIAAFAAKAHKRKTQRWTKTPTKKATEKHQKEAKKHSKLVQKASFKNHS